MKIDITKCSAKQTEWIESQIKPAPTVLLLAFPLSVGGWRVVAMWSRDEPQPPHLDMMRCAMDKYPSTIAIKVYEVK